MDRDNLNRQHPEPPPRSPQPARYIRTTSIFHKPTEEEKLSPLDPNFAQKIAMLGLKKKQQEEMDLVVDFRDFINPDTSKYAEAAEYSGGQVGDEGIERQEEEKMASLVKSPSAPTSTSHQLASLASSDNTTPTITMTTNPTPFIDPMLLDEEERIHRIATHLKTTGELVEFWGYPFEDHSVVTKDGYILGLHRIPNSRKEKECSPSTTNHRPPVVIWHGLCISSESFVCHVKSELSLALVLSDAGYDVWLANSRGNHYSLAHTRIKLDPTTNSKDSRKFWDFCMDDMALYDVPAVIEHILSRTKCKSVSYIGYSQGSAIAFSALAQIEELNHKLNVMVAIAPAMKPKPLKNKFISSLMHYSPHLLYPILGTGAFIPFAHTVQRRFPAFFKSCTEFSFNHIFGWDCRKFGGGEGAAGEERKRALYSHLFGHCSVRNVVHWFQIIGGEFSTYASSGEVKTDSSTSSSGGLFSWTPTQPSSTVRPKRLPTKHITTPLHLFHGSDDNISDAEYMREHLGGKNNTHFYSIEGYNHMDFLWAECAKERVWDDIIRILNQSNEKSEEVEGEDKTMVDKVESQENAAAADEIKEEDEESPHPSGLTKREMFFKSGNHLG